jgi:hypothetical protein
LAVDEVANQMVISHFLPTPTPTSTPQPVAIDRFVRAGMATTIQLYSLNNQKKATQNVL